MALHAFQRFAADAVDEVLEVVRTEADGEGLAKALAALHKMVRTDVLPPGKFGSVVEVARACLMNTTTPRTWRAAVELAVETGESHLRMMVAGIASGLVQPAFPDRPDLHLWARAVAKRVLRRYYHTHGVPTPDQPDENGDGGCDDLAG
jgi:hypothetical protein